MVIDTSVFIEYVRTKDKSQATLKNLPANALLYVSTVTVFEIMAGATDSVKQRDFRLLFEDLRILPFTVELAEQSAVIFQSLKRRGLMIQFNDIFIAATALLHDLPVKTLNTRHFSRMEGLRLA